jgi:CubicO group peptidase (beta-lactamase class C family)
MILGGGALDGARVLEASTVAAMSQNQMGALDVTPMPAAPPYSNAVEWWPGISCKWGLSFLINTRQTPQGRSAGSLSWAGLANSYYWIDPVKKLTGVISTQILPFYDAKVVQLFNEVETTVYRARG